MKTVIYISAALMILVLGYVGWGIHSETLHVPRSDTPFRQNPAILFFIGLIICFADGIRLLIKADKSGNSEHLKSSYVFYAGLLVVAASVIWN